LTTVSYACRGGGKKEVGVGRLLRYKRDPGKYVVLVEERGRQYAFNLKTEKRTRGHAKTYIS